jgi:beta,beta-carotene 9',10'-dioxygenase
MLNAFSFIDGRVSYANRFLETEAYRKARDGEIGFVSFAGDPCRSLFKRVTALFEETVNDNTNVNIVRLGEQYRALTEVPLPVEFDPETLETLGLAKFKDRVGGHLSTAHPHYDFQQDRLKRLLGRNGHVAPDPGHLRLRPQRRRGTRPRAGSTAGGGRWRLRAGTCATP